MKPVRYILSVMAVLLTFQLHAADGVARAGFTTAINDHEPIDAITELTNDTSKIYYFTEIRGLEGQTITHRWLQNGETQASVSIPIGGNRWRIWSSKNLPTTSTGEWQVEVLDEAGSILLQSSFNYMAATSSSTEAATEVAIDIETRTTEGQPANRATGAIPEAELYKIAPAAGGDAATAADQ